MQYITLMLCSNQKFVRQSTGSQAEVLGQSLRSHQLVIKQSGSCNKDKSSSQAFVWQSSSSCTEVVEQSMGSLWAVIKE